MKMLAKSTTLILAFGFALVGCRGTLATAPAGPSSRQAAVEEKSSKEQEVITFTGTVRHKGIEGGFFAIETEEGAKYVPLDLPEEFAKGGLKVKVTGRPRPDLVSHHMYGTLLEIIEISAR